MRKAIIKMDTQIADGLFKMKTGIILNMIQLT